MYKNQLQELAQRSCFNLPWYTCVREGPDHAPRFKAVVNFNGDIFESPHYCSTLRQAEHTAAEAALISLSSRHSLAARILDETGVYKNLLQAIAQRVGSPLPQYTTFRSGSGHLPVFTGTVELAGITFTGESAKNKKQAEKNAARAAWLSLKLLAQQDATLIPEQENNSDEHEQMRIARALQNYRLKEKIECASQNQNRVTIPFQQKFLGLTARPSSPQRPTVSTSKILPLFCQKNPAQPNMRRSQSINNSKVTLSQPLPSSSRPPSPELRPLNLHRLPVIDAAPYVPIRHCRSPYQGVAPPVTLRTSTPVFSAPPRPFPQPVRVAPPVRIKQAVTPVFTALPPVRKEDPPSDVAAPVPSKEFLNEDKETASDGVCDVDESIAVKCIEQLEM